MQHFTLKPSRAGLIVRDPVTHKQLKDEGERKPQIAYWWRRLRDGSVVEVAGEQPAATKPTVAADKKPAKETKKDSTEKGDAK